MVTGEVLWNAMFNHRLFNIWSFPTHPLDDNPFSQDDKAHLWYYSFTAPLGQPWWVWEASWVVDVNAYDVISKICFCEGLEIGVMVVVKWC